MSEEQDVERGERQPRAQKLFKVEINIYDDTSTHLQCIQYREEGPAGKLFPWRVNPTDFIEMLNGHLSEYREYISTYEDSGKDTDKPTRIATIVLNVDTQLVVDPDYVSYEEYGPNNKLRPTRPGFTEFKRAVGLHVGPELINRVIAEI
jgi:hypothetical protein